MKQFKILVVDDEKLITWSFKKKIDSKSYKIATAGSAEEALEMIPDFRPDLMFLDNKLPKMNGLEAIRHFKEADDNLFIVFMTAYGSVKIAVQAIKEGAFEYITKPFTFDEIELIIQNIKKEIKIENEIRLLRREQDDDFSFENIIGNSPKIQQIKDITKKIAQTEATTVLLLGESGTGKSLFAKAIHKAGSRSQKPFVTINCSSLPETLLESELFGYEKGAFTDAKKTKKGLFEVAEEGTVFLDEIGEIEPGLQVKLLDVIENRRIRRVGGTADIDVNIRIIAATNRDLKKNVADRKFREDLYYRLKVFQLTIPPLREHKEDIPALIDKFITEFNKQFGKTVKKASKPALKRMMKYHWPGNIRELRNIIERSVILENTDYLSIGNLPPELCDQGFVDIDAGISRINIPEEGFSLINLEREIIKQALIKADFNQTRAAKYLGITRDTLRYKKKKHKL